MIQVDQNQNENNKTATLESKIEKIVNAQLQQYRLQIDSLNNRFENQERIMKSYFESQAPQRGLECLQQHQVKERFETQVYLNESRTSSKVNDVQKKNIINDINKYILLILSQSFEQKMQTQEAKFTQQIQDNNIQQREAINIQLNQQDQSISQVKQLINEFKQNHYANIQQNVNNFINYKELTSDQKLEFNCEDLNFQNLNKNQTFANNNQVNFQTNDQGLTNQQLESKMSSLENKLEEYLSIMRDDQLNYKIEIQEKYQMFLKKQEYKIINLEKQMQKIDQQNQQILTSLEQQKQKLPIEDLYRKYEAIENQKSDIQESLNSFMEMQNTLDQDLSNLENEIQCELQKLKSSFQDIWNTIGLISQELEKKQPIIQNQIPQMI